LIFTRITYKDIIVQNLQYCQQKEKLEIFSYVIMTFAVNNGCAE